MPSPSIVARGAVGIRRESSFASGGGIDDWQVVESASLTRTNVHYYQDRVRNTPEQVGVRFGHQLVAGQIVFPVSPLNPTQWFRCGIGGAASPFTPSLPLESMAIEVQEGDVGTTYSSGDMISRIEFASRQGDVLRCTVGIEGAGLAQRATTTASFTSGDDPYLHAEGTFTLDGVANNQVVAFSVAKENNLITDLIANRRERRAIPATKAVVTGSLSILFENTTHRNRFFNALPSAIVAEYIRGVRSMKFEMVNVAYDSSERALEGQTAYIVENLNYTAFVNATGDQNSLKITVV